VEVFPAVVVMAVFAVPPKDVVIELGAGEFAFLRCEVLCRCTVRWDSGGGVELDLAMMRLGVLFCPVSVRS